MPRYRIKRQERGERYRTIEVVASSKEKAQEMICNDEGTIVSESFKQRDAETLSFEEIEDPTQKLRDYLLAKGWEMPMSEEDGCETWRFPFERRNEWPPGVGCRTQHYWDLKEAVELQMLVDRFH